MEGEPPVKKITPSTPKFFQARSRLNFLQFLPKNVKIFLKSAKIFSKSLNFDEIFALKMLNFRQAKYDYFKAIFGKKKPISGKIFFRMKGPPPQIQSSFTPIRVYHRFSPGGGGGCHSPEILKERRAENYGTPRVFAGMRIFQKFLFDYT